MDGLPVKTDKAKLMHQLEDGAALDHHPCLDDLGAYVDDGNALLPALTAMSQTYVVDGNALLQHSLLCLRHTSLTGTPYCSTHCSVSDIRS